MQDNFDLKRYLRHGNKLLNESIGGYVDLMPINRINEVEEYNVSHDDDAVGYVKNGKIVLVNRSGGINDGEVTELTPEQAQAAVDSRRQITVVGGVRVDPNHPNFKELVNQLMAGNESMMEFDEAEENLDGSGGEDLESISNYITQDIGDKYGGDRNGLGWITADADEDEQKVYVTLTSKKDGFLKKAEAFRDIKNYVKGLKDWKIDKDSATNDDGYLQFDIVRKA